MDNGQTPPAPQPIVIKQGGGWAIRIIAFLGWMGLIFAGLIILVQLAATAQYFNEEDGVTEKFYSGDKLASDKIALIRVEGLIMQGEGYIRNQIELAQKDKDVKAVVLRVDSPGGSVSASDYIYHHLNELREEREIPLVVSMGSSATSGGYYVAMAVGDEKDVIYAEPTTITGSIGVIIPHYDITGLLEEYHIKDDSIASHERKQMLSMTRTMTPDQRDLVQGLVNDMFTRFKDVVKTGRPAYVEDPEKLNELATGEIYMADQAVDLGLVDKIGFVEAAIGRAAELADLDVKKTRVVSYTKPTSLFSLGSATAASPTQSLMKAVIDTTSPKAYYLDSSLPALTAGMAAAQ
ncbi:signal peptide peptidase SppA [Blastopirellula retiformator]|uniref:Putative signal peptide peptidase SppA n=1 Tax=Blastopirellula retiformator TaxID=2527970 RepID=A0A5C5V4F4_9BACT|nr:signal peptide peptidase SppA [Blastopirellula retiformator]TWT33211.1 putative signal peptide peptidase SppA [Blastopirellula retiformator]